MGLYKYVRDAWKQPKKNLGVIQQERLIFWRKQPVTVRIDHPTRIDRARSLGYKAKQGFIVVRQRVDRGGRMREKPAGGRRPRTARRTLVLNITYQSVAEQRAAKVFNNCEVLNSYYVGQDGKHYWYEVIMVDRAHPNIQNDINLRRMVAQRGRVFRGLTSSAKKSRGFRNRGKGSEKVM